MSQLPREEDFQEDTFQRCPHDKENPYVQISRVLIRDQSISPLCRWMLIYLLSNDGNFTITIKQLISHVSPEDEKKKKFHGRDAIYKLIDEAIEAGYVKRETFLKKNLKGRGMLKRCRYFVSEAPKFKKSLQHPDFQDADQSDPVQPDYYKNNQLEERSIEYKTPTSPTQNPKKKGASAPVVAFSSEKKDEPRKPKSIKAPTKVYHCLESVDISQTAKTRICGKFSEELVQKAVTHVTAPTFKVLTTLEKAIWYFCQNPDQAERTETAEEVFKRKQESERDAYERRKGVCGVLSMKEFKLWRSGKIPDQRFNVSATGISFHKHTFFWPDTGVSYSLLEFDNPEFENRFTEAWVAKGLPLDGEIFSVVSSLLILENI